MKLKKENHLSCFLLDETKKLLKELANRKPLQVPSIYHHLPHLLKNEGSLHPAVQVGLGRTGGEKSNFSFQFHAKLCMFTQHKHANPIEIFVTQGRGSSLNKFAWWHISALFFWSRITLNNTCIVVYFDMCLLWSWFVWFLYFADLSISVFRWFLLLLFSTLIEEIECNTDGNYIQRHFIEEQEWCFFI